VYCSRCGKESPEGSQQCVNCGAPWTESYGHDQAPMGYGLPVKTSGLAIAALVLGICSIFCGCLLGIPALIMGIVALGRIDRSGGVIQGKGVATGAIVTAAIGIAFSVLILPAILFPVFSRARETDRKSTCLSNLHEAGIAIATYIGDYDSTFPSSAIPGSNPTLFCTGSGAGIPSAAAEVSWAQVIYDYCKNKDILFCPSDSSNADNYTTLSYWWKTAANDAWWGVNVASPCRKESDFFYYADQVILYEHSGFHSNETCLKDGVRINVCFMDAHAASVLLKSTTNSTATTYPTPVDATATAAAGEPMYYNYDFTRDAMLPVARNADAGNYGDRF